MIHREVSDKRYQMDSLDGLRGFAALLVVFSHTSRSGMYFLPWLDLRGIGKSGVFLFFLLSSFLLTLPLLNKGKALLTLPVMAHYWQRRFFRIYPLFTLYLLSGVISTWFIATVFGKSGIGIPFALDLSGFVKHLLLLKGKGITWSIAVEFKFYFVLPFLALATVRVSAYGFGLTTLFFVGLLLLSQWLFPQSRAVVNDVRLAPYLPIFIIGMFLAYLQNYTNGRADHANDLQRIYKYLGYAGAAGIIYMTPLAASLFGDRVPGNHFHKQFILYALFWSFVLLSAVNVKGLLQRFFTLRVLRFYGALSFSLYLFHPIFIEGCERLQLNGYLAAWFTLLASTVSACISFKLLEGPVSRFKLIRTTQS